MSAAKLAKQREWSANVFEGDMNNTPLFKRKGKCIQRSNEGTFSNLSMTPEDVSPVRSPNDIDTFYNRRSEGELFNKLGRQSMLRKSQEDKTMASMSQIKGQKITMQ